MNSTALGVIWLPLLSTIPQSQELLRAFSELNNITTSSLDGSNRISGVRSLNIPAKPQAFTRALCSHCSCESDNGCLYNCDKCGSQCLTCDCNKSIACRYNCDKCEDVQIGDGDNCHNLDLCGHGSKCQEIKDNNYPKCDFDCQDCGVSADANSPSVSATVAETDAEHFLNNLNNQFNPNKPIGSFVPHPQPVEAEQEVSDQDDADHFLSNLNNQFNPDQPGGIVVPNKPWKPVPEPVEVEQEVSDQDESFSWLDLHPQASSCVSAAGQTCKFPFKYQGTTFFKCAPMEGKMKDLNPSDAYLGWCSTRRDINGIHIRGPIADPWRNVGLCGEECL